MVKPSHPHHSVTPTLSQAYGNPHHTQAHTAQTGSISTLRTHPLSLHLRYSEEWGNAVWGKSRIASVTANAVTAPNATLTADKVIESTATGAHHIYQGLTISSNTEVTVSTWVKAAERTSVQVALYCRNATYVTCVVNLLDGTFTSSNSNYIYNVVPSGDGWYRISISGSNLSGTDVTRLHVFLVNASGASSYTGDGSSGLYVWGGQINLGLAATDYVLTTSTYANTSFAVNNVSLTAGVTYDSMTDVPTLTNATTANYAVLNPLDAPSGANIASGNLNATNLSTVWRTRVSTVHTSSGKYYAEVLGFTAAPFMFGIVGSNWRANIADSRFWLDPTGKAYYSADGNKYTNGSGSAYGATYTFGDVIGIALDLDAGTLEFYKNGVSQGVAFSGLSGGFQFAVACYANNSSLAINFGQRPFAYTPPTNFVALNTFNLPDSTIVKGNTVMDATLYTGNGSTQTITNAAGFQPDLVWVKGRSSANQDHTLVDSVRGVSRRIRSNQTGAEVLESGFNITAFNSTGFTAVDDTNGGYNVNGSVGGTFSGAAQYVGWQWQAGGAAVTNTAGTISAQVSANPTAGFSVVVYTGNGTNGATVGHGLGVSPSMIIEKGRSTTYSWSVQGCGVMWTPATSTLFLNATNALNPGGGIAAPTSSVFTPSATLYANESGVSNVAYVFAEIAGFSKFGSYVGNGSADGPFIYTGFKPAFVLRKGISIAGISWSIVDDARNPYNLVNANLFPNTTGAESVPSGEVDFLSNGFKFRSSSFSISGVTYIYAAFAENPFKNSLAR
jgi:hypothetical protein